MTSSVNLSLPVLGMIVEVLKVQMHLSLFLSYAELSVTRNTSTMHPVMVVWFDNVSRSSGWLGRLPGIIAIQVASQRSGRHSDAQCGCTHVQAIDILML